MIRVVINGILGRMGQEISNAILRDQDVILIGGVDTLETFYADEVVVSTDPNEVLGDTDTVIDFSSPEGTVNIAKSCLERKIPLVTGTTALSENQQEQVMKLSEKVAVVQASNFSVGINLLTNLIERAAMALKGGFDAEIVEAHHRHKKDSPSGTALMLARTLAKTLELPEEEVIQYGRKGTDLSRGKEVAIHSLRGGSVIGEHQVNFLSSNENIKITHQAQSRKIFSDGVLQAVQWIATQPAGYYTMQDVLNLRI